MVRNTRRQWAAAASALAGGLAAACGAGGSGGDKTAALPPKKVRSGTTLTWHSYISDDSLLSEVNRLWTAKHPDIKIEHSFSKAAEITEKLVGEIAAGTPVDVAMTGYADIPALQPHLANIEPYARRDKYPMQDFVQAAINQYKYGNGQYAMPHSFPVRVGAYNATMFAARGVKPPPAAWNAAGWSWDDFVTTTRALNDPGATPRVWGTIWQQMGTRPNQLDVIQFCINNGGAYLRDDGKECLLTQPRSREALQFIQDLVQRHRVAPAPEELEGVSGDLFIQGRAAWGIWGPVSLANYRRQISFEWALCPIPLGAGAKQRTPVIGASAWMMLDGGQNKEEAWEFIQTLTSPEYERAAAAIVGYVPPRRSVMAEYASSEPP
jgi:multiple sugar transport system substrate-binding protein